MFVPFFHRSCFENWFLFIHLRNNCSFLLKCSFLLARGTTKTPVPICAKWFLFRKRQFLCACCSTETFFYSCNLCLSLLKWQNLWCMVLSWKELETQSITYLKDISRRLLTWLDKVEHNRTNVICHLRFASLISNSTHCRAWASGGKLGQVAQCSHSFFPSPLLFVQYLCKWNKLCESHRCQRWTRKARLTGQKLTAHHRNLNGFTWKRTKQIACITVQYRSVIMMDLKVNAVAGNTWTPSTVGSFSLTKSQTKEDSLQVPKNLPMLINRVTSQNQLAEYCLHFQFPAQLANHLQNSWLEVVVDARKIAQLSR